MHNLICISLFQFMFLFRFLLNFPCLYLYLFSKTTTIKTNWYSPLANINVILDSGAMPSQNLNITVFTTVFKTILSSQLGNYPPCSGLINPNLSVNNYSTFSKFSIFHFPATSKCSSFSMYFKKMFTATIILR